MTQIHQISGRNLVDALERARESVGSQAVVLSRRNAASGVTLALADNAPASRDELSRLRGRAKSILAHAPEAAPLPRPSTAEVEERLRRAGCSATLTERVVEAVAGRIEEGVHPLDLAAEELGAAFPVASMRKAPGTVSVLAFLGQPGAGKTTTAAKLALRLTRAGKRVALVTTDTHRVGAVAQAKALGEHIGCPAISLRDPSRLAEALAGSTPTPDVVLMDTSGRIEADSEGLTRLDAALAAGDLAAGLTRYLTLPASASQESLLQASRAATYDGCIITRLDETSRPAPALEVALHEKLPVAFLCDGSQLEGHLHRASGAVFGDIFLCGRVQ